MTSAPLFIHVEEPSMEAYLGVLLPRLELAISVHIINHGSKQHLLRDLPKRLASYANWPVAMRPSVIVLVDRDDDDCRALKQRLESTAQACNLATKSNPRHGRFSVVNRLVVEELEAWHFGDPTALAAAFPGVSATLGRKRGYRDPDAVAGGTHEALRRELSRAGHYTGSSNLPKVDVARRMAARVSIAGNLSRSFQIFHEGLNAIVAQMQEAANNG